MPLLQKLFSWLRRPRAEQERQEEWANRFDQPPAKPKNPLPLDPKHDNWRT
jgi:hypothetical protein